MEYLGRAPMTRQETAESLARYEQHWREHGFGLLAAEDRETGTLVGRSGVAYHRVWRQDPEVGWAFDPAFWGRGFATEAGSACVDWAFAQLGFARLVSITTEENLRSRRVMAKLGFRLLEQRRDARIGVLLWIHSLARGDASRGAR
jgi:RimJ/RimL family protein N-acetyltransferase